MSVFEAQPCHFLACGVILNRYIIWGLGFLMCEIGIMINVMGFK